MPANRARMQRKMIVRGLLRFATLRGFDAPSVPQKPVKSLQPLALPRCNNWHFYCLFMTGPRGRVRVWGPEPIWRLRSHAFRIINS